MDKLYDMKIAMFYLRHIEHPCTDHITGRNIRPFYIKRVKEVLPTLTNPYAISLLKSKIKEYGNI
jgi:hypothetical protein